MTCFIDFVILTCILDYGLGLLASFASFDLALVFRFGCLLVVAYARLLCSVVLICLLLFAGGFRDWLFAPLG